MISKSIFITSWLHKELNRSKVPIQLYATSIFFMLFITDNQKYLFLFLAVVFLLCFILKVHIRENLKKEVQTRILHTSKKIEKELLDIFWEVEQTMISIGQESLKTSPENRFPVWQRFREIFNHSASLQKKFIWPEFAWLDTDFKQLVNTRLGILNPPVDISQREYTKVVFQTPWKLHFARPGPILPLDESHSWILPFGMGIVDKNGNRVGTVAGAFYRTDIIKKIDSLVSDKSINFALLDTHGDIFVQITPKDLSKQIPLSQLEKLKNSPFFRETTLTAVPFTLVTYMDDESFLKEFYLQFIPSLLKLFGGALFSTLFLYFFFARVLKQTQELKRTQANLEQAALVARSAATEKEKVIRNTQEKLQKSFQTMVIYTEILLKDLKQEISLELSSEKQIEFLEKIKEAEDTLTKIIANLPK